MTMVTFDVEFRKDGTVFEQSEVNALLGGLHDVSDLLVVCHGWNNDTSEAKDLYGELIGNIDRLLALRDLPTEQVPHTLSEFTESLRGRTFAALRLFWPSKRFADGALIPGGGAASAAAEQANARAVEEVLDRLSENADRLGDMSPDPSRATKMARAKALLPQLATVDAQREFVTLLRQVLDPAMAETDDASAGFFAAAPETLFANASAPVVAPSAGSGGGGTSITDGGAAGLGDLLTGALAAARRIANYATYYQMKARAGTVGSTGVADMLKAVRASRPDIRIHLAGHSFGGRLVTAAAHALSPQTKGVTMSLLQAAFSHNALSGGFGEENQPGFFRRVISESRISGPIIITHTKNDKAVGIAYPLASRLAGQNAAALGDQNDPYGGMGRNGAQHTAEADSIATLGLPGTEYSFKAGRVHNILADVIANHGDVARVEVAYAILCASGISR